MPQAAKPCIFLAPPNSFLTAQKLNTMFWERQLVAPGFESATSKLWDHYAGNRHQTRAIWKQRSELFVVQTFGKPDPNLFLRVHLFQTKDCRLIKNAWPRVENFTVDGLCLTQKDFDLNGLAICFTTIYNPFTRLQTYGQFNRGPKTRT